MHHMFYSSCNIFKKSYVVLNFIHYKSILNDVIPNTALCMCKDFLCLTNLEFIGTNIAAFNFKVSFF